MDLMIKRCNSVTPSAEYIIVVVKILIYTAYVLLLYREKVLRKKVSPLHNSETKCETFAFTIPPLFHTTVSS